MKSIYEVAIDNAIIHKLDNKESTLVLSDFELELDQKQKEFLQNHVLRCIHDSELKKAQFDPGDNEVKNSVCNIFENSSGFIEESKIIATKLFRSMQGNKNISSADVVICTFEGNGKNYISVLKMDYHSTMVSRIEQVEDKTKITIVDQGTSLPNIQQKLQKCVFIEAPAEKEELELMLLDKQTRKDSSTEIAIFFARTFLQCSLVFTNRRRTSDFSRAVEKYAKQQSDPDIGQKITDNMRSSLLNQVSINAVEFAKSLFEKEEVQKEFLDFLTKQGVTDFNFNIDKEYANAQYGTRKIVTKEGIEIKIKDADYNNADRFEKRKKENGKYDITIKNVQVVEWD